MLRPLLPPIATGLLGGFVAGKWQIAILRYGDIAADQSLRYWEFFLGGGVALAVVGAVLAMLLAAALRRGRMVPATVGAILAVGAGAGVFVPRNVRERPDVLLLVTDTTRADHLSLYGYDRPTTRFLQELAGRSVVFDTAMSQGSHTIVSTPCILASLYPSDHGMIGYTSKLWDGFLLVSELLKFSGYSTFGAVTNPHLSKRNGFDQGWDSYVMLGSGTSVPVFASRVNESALATIDSLRSATATPATAAPDTAAPDTAGTPEASSAPPQHEERSPIFGFLFYTDPHAPYAAPPEYQRLYDPDWSGRPLLSWVVKKSGEPRAAQLRNLIANYDATITYWDDQFRALCDSLETRDMLDNTLLIYTADHGEEFLEHGGIGHGSTLFEEVTHVPLLFSLPVPVKLPRLPRTHRRVSDIVSSVDIVPTLTDYLRIPVAHEMRGRSAIRLALGRKDEGPERDAFLEQILKQYGTFDIRALRTPTHKYVSRIAYQTEYHDEWGTGDLFFDLTQDPGEQVNLFEERPDEAQRYATRLRTWIDRAKDESVKVEQVEPDAAQLEQLKALGYVDQ